MRKCFVCERKEKEFDSIHTLPRNTERAKEWVEAMGFVWNGEFNRNKKICNYHFTPSCFTYPGSRVLNRNAVPSLYPVTSLKFATVSSSSAILESSDILPSVNTLSPDLPVACSWPLSPLSVSPEPPSSPDPLLLTCDVKCSNLVEYKAKQRRRSFFKNIDALSLQELPPEKKELVGIIKKKENCLRKLKKVCREMSHNLKILLKDIDQSPLVNNILGDMSASTVTFMLSQIRCDKQVTQTQKWTEEEQLLSLALYKRNSRCYFLIRRLVALPSPSALQSLLSSVPFKAGINKHLFKQLSRSVNNYENIDRLCILMFGEMQLKEHTMFNCLTGSTEGLEDYGDGIKGERPANQATVFMIRELRKNFLQPVAYYFSHGPMSAQKTERCIREVIDATHGAGLRIIATVCDTSTAKMLALQNMRASKNEPCIQHGDRKIFTLFDAPYLLKCFRKLLENYSVRFLHEHKGSRQIMETNWEDVLTAFSRNEEDPDIFRTFSKVLDEQFQPILRSEMKMEHVTQVLSHRMATYMYHLTNCGVLPPRAIGTAFFIAKIDQLFDSFNGHSRFAPNKKKLLSWLTEESPHMQFWDKMCKDMNEWEYVSSKRHKKAWKPLSHKGWMISMEAMKGIWNLVKDEGFSYLIPRALNKDPLEKFFDAIRTGCGNKRKPTTSQFISSLKTQIICGFTIQSLKNPNFEEEDAKLFSNLHSFVFT